MHESLAGGGARNVVETFEPVQGADAVQTPRQVRRRLSGWGVGVGTGCCLKRVWIINCEGRHQETSINPLRYLLAAWVEEGRHNYQYICKGN
jgi:hypothetical protein